MGTKRSKNQIIFQILKICDGNGASKTKIVYASGLNFRTIKPYLVSLDDNDLIETVEGSHPIYRTTKKGEVALTYLKALDELMA
jgi:predicted transcriptional regulator